MRVRSGAALALRGPWSVSPKSIASAQPTIGWMPDDGELLGEFQRPEHVVGVGERERRLLVGLRQLGQARDGERAFQQRIVRVHVQVHEIEIGHVYSKLG